MKKAIRPILTLIGMLIVAGGVSLFVRVTLLELENLDRPRKVQVRISSSETFSMFYIHSIYREPVIEDFKVEGEAIVLKGVRTKSPAVMEYYRFSDMQEYHPMNVMLGADFLIKRGMGEGQGLIVKGRKSYLSEIGERGDRIRLSVESSSLGKYLFFKAVEAILKV